MEPRFIQFREKAAIQAFIFLLGAFPCLASPRAKFVIVSVDGSGDFRSLDDALAALPDTGGTIRIKPGIYREQVKITKPRVRLVGDVQDPSRVVIVFNASHGAAGGTLESASVSVDGDDFFAEGVTFQNDFSRNKPLQPQGSQAVALLLRGDRAVLRHVRMLGAQDTLYAGSQSCASEQGPCIPARQYFSDCYIEGNIDFIFGDGMTFFHNCTIHAIAHNLVFLTAQSKHYPEEASGYVFDHCTVTADAEARHIFLGRPWRPYSTVIFLNTKLDANIEPAGWREWHPAETHSLDTSFYAEFGSIGRGANPQARDPHSKQLTQQEAKRYSVREFLSGKDHWDPERVH